MLDVKILKNEVLPNLSYGKVGKKREIDLLEIVMTIFYRLKTGCQWRELPLKQFISREGTKWGSIYYHFNKWCKDGSWEKVWTTILKKYKQYLDMSCVNLDGSHTRAFRGGDAVGYQGRKKYNSTNMLYLIDNQGVILFCSNPISGNHNDLYEVGEQFDRIIQMAKASEINLSHLFLNADAGFDDSAFRNYLEGLYIEANIEFNKRNGSSVDRDIFFDEELYRKRSKCEHSFAWMDGFKGLLVRYETLASTWLSMNLMGMAHIFLRKIKGHI